MRIGIDARELCGRPTGVGRYLSGLLDEWARPGATPHEFVLYAPEALAVQLDARRFATRHVQGGTGTWWEQVRLPKAVARDHLDVFFAPAYTAPVFRNLPTVLALHDISFAAHPEWFPTREGARRRLLARRAAADARAVITISQFSRREIADRFHVPESKIHVIPPGVDAVPLARDIRSAPNVLYVGSIFNRRHIPELIKAFELVARAHSDTALDIVGDNRSYPRQDIASVIDHHGLKGRARWRRYVDDEELARLYSCSRAFAFLSEYEGLGLTPLEALRAGVPPVLLDTPVARESCGEAALYVPVTDPRTVAAALEQLLFDDAARARVIAHAPAVLGRYDWPRAALETLAVLEAAHETEPNR
jgi:glycosyltransferase involved in cell wall biosynthesis